MKLPSLTEYRNSWPKSLAYLESLVLDYFAKNNLEVDDVWFPDIEVIFPKRLNDKKIINVVLFGGFLERFFESGNWPNKEYKIWVIGSAVKNILVNQFAFNKDQIQLIPRYELFPKTQNISKKLDLTQKIRFVYSGRLSAQKNIEMALAFIEELKNEFNLQVEIYLLGEWDNYIPKNLGRFVIDSYQNELENFISKLQLNNVKIMSGLDRLAWQKYLEGNVCLINFSTFVCEDFGLAVAEANAQDFPMILSYWGGHIDVQGENIILIDARDIATYLSPLEIYQLKAKNLVKKFKNNELKLANNKKSSEKTNFHQVTNLNDLNKLRLVALEKYGPELSFLGQDRMSLLAATENGKKFFNEFNLFFSSQVNQDE